MSNESKTLVLQSHATPLPFPFLQICLESVAEWARERGYKHQIIGDELFNDLSPELLDKTRNQTLIATDLGRLHWMQRYLIQGWQQVLWLDSDVLVIEPAALRLPQADFAVGREHWVTIENGKLRTRTKVHNAALFATARSRALPFYLESATRLVLANQGRMSPQFVGPKLLTALHNVVQFPVLETVNMLPISVAQELIGAEAGGLSPAGAALQRFQRAWVQPPAALNLCCSSVRSGHINEPAMRALAQGLVRDPQGVLGLPPLA